MELSIKGKNIEIPENAREYIAKRVNKFGRHLRDIDETKVEISEEKTQSKDNRYVVEITLDVQGTFLRGVERAADIFTGVDIAAEMMDRQIRRYKDRLQGKKRRKAGIRGATIPETSEPVSHDEESRLIKVKHFAMKPMPPDEAIEQMELLGHDFFVFFNDATEQVNVVYRRREGNYGLIVPELS